MYLLIKKISILLRKKVRTEKFYSVGYSPGLKKYVLAITVPWIGYYEDYYEISEEEYNMFGTYKLDEIASSLADATSSSPRFLYSGRSGGKPEIAAKLFPKTKK